MQNVLFFKSCIFFMSIDRYLDWLPSLTNVTWMPIKTDNASISPLWLLPRHVLIASSMSSLKLSIQIFHSGCIDTKSLHAQTQSKVSGIITIRRKNNSFFHFLIHVKEFEFILEGKSMVF